MKTFAVKVRRGIFDGGDYPPTIYWEIVIEINGMEFTSEQYGNKKEAYKAYDEIITAIKESKKNDRK